MSVLLLRDSRVVIQGITGKEGSFHYRFCRSYGTKIVAGVTPGKGGIFLDDTPIYNTVTQAVNETNANVSLIFVPAPFAADAIMEAAEAGVDLAVCITEGIPIMDMMKVKAYLRGRKTKLIGPNCPGIISPPEKAKAGIMPNSIHRSGSIGVVSRSGSLSYEVVDRLSKSGFGQSTCLGIGGDPVVGLSFADCLKLFAEDKKTKAVVLIGEIGGQAEEEAAEFVKNFMAKPVVAYICGATAPPEKRMGHAGAIVSGGRGGALVKIETLREAGVKVVDTLDQIPKELKNILKRA